MRKSRRRHLVVLTRPDYLLIFRGWFAAATFPQNQHLRRQLCRPISMALTTELEGWTLLRPLFRIASRPFG